MYATSGTSEWFQECIAVAGGPFSARLACKGPPGVGLLLVLLGPTAVFRVTTQTELATREPCVISGMLPFWHRRRGRQTAPVNAAQTYFLDRNGQRHYIFAGIRRALPRAGCIQGWMKTFCSVGLTTALFKVWWFFLASS
jgi:hypothetical protein